MDKYEALICRLSSTALIAKINKNNPKACITNKGIASLCDESSAALEELYMKVKCLTADYPELENTYF